MKIIRRILGWILILLIGIFVGLNINSWSNNAVDWVQEIIAPYEISDSQEDESSTSIVQDSSPTNESNEIDYDLIENTIIQHVNDLREELGAQPVVINETLRTGAYIRAKEVEEVFSHTRPDGSNPFTVFEQEDLIYNYGFIGENLAMATYFGNDKSMSEFLFQGWVDSPDHYETMINPSFEEIGVGVHYDGEILYATQFFGTER